MEVHYLYLSESNKLFKLLFKKNEHTYRESDFFEETSARLSSSLCEQAVENGAHLVLLGVIAFGQLQAQRKQHPVRFALRNVLRRLFVPVSKKHGHQETGAEPQLLGESLICGSAQLVKALLLHIEIKRLPQPLQIDGQISTQYFYTSAASKLVNIFECL